MSTLAYELYKLGVNLEDAAKYGCNECSVGEVRWVDSKSWPDDGRTSRFAGAVPVLVVRHAWDDNTGYRDAVLLSNLRWLVQNVDDEHVMLTGGWSGDGVALWLGEYPEDRAEYLAEVLTEIEDYLVIDEELMSEVEEEFREECWEQFMARDLAEDVAKIITADELIPGWNGEESDLAEMIECHEDLRYPWFHEAMEAEGDYGELEYETWWFPKTTWDAMVKIVASKFAEQF